MLLYYDIFDIQVLIFFVIKIKFSYNNVSMEILSLLALCSDEENDKKHREIELMKEYKFSLYALKEIGTQAGISFANSK